jgi:hypothetical protein
MPTSSSSKPDPQEQTLAQILAALQSIAAAVNRGTDVLVNPADERPQSQEQSTTILDYLVLRELVGRQADQTRRTVAATRFPDGFVLFDNPIPTTVTKVAVFTRRSVAPDEVPEITDESVVADRVKKLDPKRVSDVITLQGIVLGTVTDDQPIVRLELRQDDDLAVALGPRLAPVA